MYFAGSDNVEPSDRVHGNNEGPTLVVSASDISCKQSLGLPSQAEGLQSDFKKFKPNLI